MRYGTSQDMYRIKIRIEYAIHESTKVKLQYILDIGMTIKIQYHNMSGVVTSLGSTRRVNSYIIHFVFLYLIQIYVTTIQDTLAMNKMF
jgi:hypothetical protein